MLALSQLLPSPVGWGIVWKLLLSRLGLFKELFSGAEGREVKPQAEKTVQISLSRPQHIVHGDGRQRRPVDTTRTEPPQT